MTKGIIDAKNDNSKQKFHNEILRWLVELLLKYVTEIAVAHIELPWLKNWLPHYIRGEEWDIVFKFRGRYIGLKVETFGYSEIQRALARGNRKDNKTKE